MREAQMWLNSIMDVADENSAGRRAWMADLNQMLLVNVQDRRELVFKMTERDWFSDWHFCLRSLQNDQDAIFLRQRRLQRLHTIWLQFTLFSELVAEVFLSFFQQRNNYGLDSIQSFDKVIQEFLMTKESRQVVQNVRSNVTKPGQQDVAEFTLAGIHFEIAVKSWQGHKRLGKEMTRFAQFRSLLELFLSQYASNARLYEPSFQAILSNLPTFSILSAFSIQNIRVVARAAPLRHDQFLLSSVEARDLTSLRIALEDAQMLRHFPYQELPDLIVRRGLDSNVSTLKTIRSRYENIFLNSFRSSRIHGVLIRAEIHENHSNRRLQVMSAHDVHEIVQTKAFEWIPYLDFQSYQSAKGSAKNKAATAFLLKDLTSPLTGDLVIAVYPDQNKLRFDLPEPFVTQYKVDLHPLVQKLQEFKQNTALFAVAASSLSFLRNKSGDTRLLDTSEHVAREYEDGVKRLFIQHIQDVTAQLLTLGDTPLQATNSTRPSAINSKNQSPNVSRTPFIRSKTMTSMPRPRDVFTSPSVLIQHNQHDNPNPLSRPHRSSTLSSCTQTRTTQEKAPGTYVIDALHLRQILKQTGVNLRFLPIIFQFLNPLNQRGVQILVASEIIARIAKHLFQYQMLQDTRKTATSGKARKTRLIQFLNAIMHGLFYRKPSFQSCNMQACTGDQFWNVDGPVFYSLGTFASSFALNVKLENDVLQSIDTCLDQYRQVLQRNPSVLFHRLLSIFQARLQRSQVSKIHQHRFDSAPLLQQEVDLIFLNETHDPKLAIQRHSDILASQLQFFRIQYDKLKSAMISNDTLVRETHQPSWMEYYQALSHRFQQRLTSPHVTKLENAIRSWQDHTIVQPQLNLAFGATTALSSNPIQTTNLSTRIHSHCNAAINHMASSQAFLPITYKLAVDCLDFVSTYDNLFKAIKDSNEFQEWLRFVVYRPAHAFQVMQTMSSHPISSLFYWKKNTEQLNAIVMSARQFQREECRELWRSIRSSVYVYCQRIHGNTLNLKQISTYQDHTLGLTLIWSQLKDLPYHQDPHVRTNVSPNTLQSLHMLSFPFLHCQVVQIACGYDYTARVTENRGLYTFGRIKLGRLDHGNEDDCLTPQFVAFFTKLLALKTHESVQSVACGQEHTLLVTQRSSLYGFASTTFKRSKVSETTRYFLLTRVNGLEITAVACGRKDTMALTMQGRVYAVSERRLGTGFETNEDTFVLVQGFQVYKIVAVDAEEYYSCALSVNEDVYTWGVGIFKALEYKNREKCRQPTLVKGPWNGKIGHVAIVVTLSPCEGYSTLVATSNGLLYGWGDAAIGQLGSDVLTVQDLVVQQMSIPTKEMLRVTCDAYTSVVSTTEGHAFVWGSSAAGEGALLNRDDAVHRNVD